MPVMRCWPVLIAILARTSMAGPCDMLPACHYIKTGSVIFAGTVVATSGQNAKTRFRIDEAFVGLARDQREVEIDSAPFPPTPGDRWLVDAVRENGKVMPTMCGATGPLLQEGRLLREFRDLVRGGPLKVGRVEVFVSAPVAPLANATVSLARRASAQTGEHGESRFDGVPPGDYEVHVRMSGYMLEPRKFVHVVPGGCAAIHVRLNHLN